MKKYLVPLSIGILGTVLGVLFTDLLTSSHSYLYGERDWLFLFYYPFLAFGVVLVLSIIFSLFNPPKQKFQDFLILLAISTLCMIKVTGLRIILYYYFL